MSDLPVSDLPMKLARLTDEGPGAAGMDHRSKRASLATQREKRGFDIADEGLDPSHLEAQ